ncbi:MULTISPECIES: hypothetical protein [unclassified Nocardiopsis]|uniref:hypothetical protein n=1 Tax=Nocardiopsis TaxID=2013 RepID=UPI00387ADE27
MPGGHELSDAERALLAPLMPTGPHKSEKWADHRRWPIDGTWQRIADRLRIDPTTVRAHQHAAGAVKKGTRHRRNRTGPRPWDAPGAV